MSIAALKEAIHLLGKMPVLWIPGLVGGIFAAALWIILAVSGTFFTSRLLIIYGLVILLFITGMFVVIRNNGGGIKMMLAGGIRHYFQVLLPQLIIMFGMILVFVLVIITLTLAGFVSDAPVITFLTIGIMIPTLVLTFYYDCAAVFEEKRVFESIKRSIELVTQFMNDVIMFFVISFALFIGSTFILMVIWEAVLYDKLEPVTRYTETQLQAFTPEQLIILIGPYGMWITAAVLFLGVFLLIPLLYTYKACFFIKLTSRTPIIQQQVTGEYDSKGRWYKY